MSLDWRSIMKIVGSLGSPKQAVTFLFDKLAGKDAKLAASLKQMYLSGEDPAKVLSQYASEGKITLTQLKKVKECYQIARKLGMKQQIPQSEWVKAEQAIRNCRKPPTDGNGGTTGSGFGGF